MGLGFFFKHLPGIRQRIRTIGQARADAARMNNAAHLRFEFIADEIEDSTGMEGVCTQNPIVGAIVIVTGILLVCSLSCAWISVLGRGETATLLPLRRQQLQKHGTDYHRLVLSRSSHQCVGPFKPVRSQDLHFPSVVFARTDDRHPPISRSVVKSVFDQRTSFSPDLSIPGVTQFE